MGIFTNKNTIIPEKDGFKDDLVSRDPHTYIRPPSATLANDEAMYCL
jgi:hypothetical protein